VSPAGPADRYSRLNLISWFERPRVRAARVLVVGAGALGNETLKALALFGIGGLAVCDFDAVELSNLTRSPLFTDADIGTNKAVAAAAALRRINPEILVVPLALDVRGEVGTAFFRPFDVVVGAVDSREGRLAINRACWRVERPFVDGGLDVFSGVVKVFVPPSTACYECTMSPEDHAVLPRRNSCGLLAQAAEAAGAVPTTPVSAGVAGALQAQEVLKLLHPDAPGRRLAGEGYAFDGLWFEPMLVRYPRRPDSECRSHVTYPDLEVLPGDRRRTTVAELAAWAARADGGECTFIRFERDILLTFECDACHTSEPVRRPETLYRGEPPPCPGCGSRNRRAGRILSGVIPEEYPTATLADLGVPPMDVLHLQTGDRTRRVTLGGDARELFPDGFLEPT
jgi:adenylyltransferase/sulfurtransferase